MKRKLITLLTCSLLFLNCVIPIQAKANLSALQNGTFSTLSEADKQQTTVALVNKISSELGIVHTPRTHFFVWPNSSFAAYTYFNPNDIYINTNLLSNPADANILGMTLEQYLVKVVAHEVRHVYQSEHRNDDTDFGRQCKYCIEHYITYDADAAGYESQFTERDADAYGDSYANKFVKSKKSIAAPKTKELKANNGKIFDPVFYADKYPDVKQVLGTDAQVLLNHYNTYGINEKRMANANDIP